MAVNPRRVCAVASLLAVLGALVASAADTKTDEDEPGGQSAEIVDKYLQATQNHEDALRGASMQVSIDATIPNLKEHGTLKALRKISKVGTVSYHLLGFQGDNTVKTEVIARYLQAEQQGQGDQKLAIAPENYKFKSKGRKQTDLGDVFVLQLTPRHKKVGLWKGELWLDAQTYLPVLEKGKLVKNPSIWFKKVEFERDFTMQDGVPVPKRIAVTTDVRLFGKVHMNIDFSDYQANADNDGNQPPRSESGLGSSLAAK